MKEELLANLVGIVEYVKQGVEFTKEQAPLFVQEFITFKTYLYLFWDIVSIVGIIICSILSVKFLKKVKIDDDYGVVVVLIIGLGIVFFIAFGYCTELLLEVHFAPRVFIVERLLDILK